MIQADQRAGFRKPVALHHNIAKPPPEFFSVLIERGAAGNNRPELPAKPSTDFAEPPPAFQKVLFFRSVLVLFDKRAQIVAQLVL
jgi:hypothetical protein